MTRSLLDEDLYWEREMEARREALEDEHAAWVEAHTSGEVCECGRRYRIRRVLDGADADGNRGMWVDEVYCAVCD